MISNPLLTILIPTVTRHLKFFKPLWDDLINQTAKRNDVELLGLVDNRSVSIGEKRNTLLQMARGNWIVFIDSDDSLASGYIASVCNLLEDFPSTDLVLYQTLALVPDNPDILCHYHKSWSFEDRKFIGDPPTRYYGPPAHHHVWKRSLISHLEFPHLNTGEDFAWTSKARLLVKNQKTISRVLYYYNYDISSSESAKED